MRFVVLFVVLGLAAPPAFADARAEAQQKLALAAEHHAAGRFKEALELLTVAYALDPQPDILYAIAQVHVKLGDCTQAITFYERFLSTHPADDAGDAAREAIEVCKTTPPPAAAETVEPAPMPAPSTAPHPAAPIADAPRAWYKDRLGLALVGSGLVSGIVGLVMYRGAQSDLDAAEAAATYPEHVDLVDRAHGKRTLAAVFGIGGVALVGAGAVRMVMVRKREASAIAVVPTTRGGFVTWSGSW